MLVKISRWDGGEQHSAGGNAVRIDWREQESLAQVDIKDALAANHDHDESEEDPSHERVREHAVFVLVDVLVQVAEKQHVKSLVAIASGRVDWQQNRPGDQCAEEGDGCTDANVAQEKVGVERLVLESVRVWDLPESTEPVEEASWESWSSLSVLLLAIAQRPLIGIAVRNLLLAQSAKVRSWSIETALGATKNQEDGDVDKSDNQCWNESRDETGDRSIVNFWVSWLFRALSLVGLPLEEIVGVHGCGDEISLWR